jgi:pimeloyl-[acyl-carrier protein] methyl ester esterase
MSRQWLFIHGWGYDASAWQPLIDLLPPEDSVACVDRGYFGAPTDAAFTSAPSQRVLVTHSFGQQLFDAERMGLPDLWILICGFDRFIDTPTQARPLRRMRSKLDTEPDAVLRDFYARCGEPGRVPRPIRDLPRLAADLERLVHAEAPISVMRQCRKIVILHARFDAIVPIERAERLGLPVVSHPEGSHALPFNHSHWCWKSINPLLE